MGLTRKAVETSDRSPRIDAFLASLDLARARTPDELAHLDAEIEQAFAASLELRQEARLTNGHGLWKKYLAEIRPLMLLVKWLYPGRQNVLCKPSLSDKENYDAVISHFGGAEKVNLLVEFTYAKDGYEEHLRMKILNEKGRVNLLAPITPTGTENTGHYIDIDDGTPILKARTLEKHLRLIIDRINKKAQRRYGPDHILVVNFNDSVSFRSDSEIDLLGSSVVSAVDLSTLHVKSLYLLGASGDTFSELPLKH